MKRVFDSKLTGWKLAVRLCEAYLKRPCKADVLLDRLPPVPLQQRRHCRFLFFRVIRNLKLISWVLTSLLSKQPKPRLQSILFVAAGELLAADKAAVPKIIDYAVEQAKGLVSRHETGLVNAVLRKAYPLLIQPDLGNRFGDRTARLALAYSHPEWLVHRWIEHFGPAATEILLQWDQQPTPLYLYLSPKDRLAVLPQGLRLTLWPSFYQFDGGAWQAVEKVLEKGRAIIMDPASHRPVELLGVRPDETVLDLCAAPGGKSFLIAEALAGTQGRLVSLNLSGSRMARLRKNLAPFHELLSIALVEADLRHTTPKILESKGLPCAYNAVLLDAPCSNTGVLRRRPDAKWRLQPSDIETAATLQLKLLCRAAAFVRPGGRLVYSTCSLEPEENVGVIERFLAQGDGTYRLSRFVHSTPWEKAHDGGYAFLLHTSEV